MNVSKIIECEGCPCLQKIIELERAFPDGPDNHRIAHEAWIRAKQAEEEFWKELKMEIAKKGTLGFLYLVGGLILIGAATKLGINIKP